MGLSNHQWPVEEDEGSARQHQIHGTGYKLKYEGTCENHMISSTRGSILIMKMLTYLYSDLQIKDT